MFMFDAFKKKLKELQPRFYDLINIDQVEQNMQRWLMWDNAGISTPVQEYNLVGDHYIVSNANKVGGSFHALWLDPSPALHNWLRESTRVHATDPPYCFGVVGHYYPGTQSFMLFNSGFFVPKNYHSGKHRYTIVPVNDTPISANQMKNALKFTSSALQMRLVCAEAINIGYPIERKGRENILRSTIMTASTLDKLL